MKNIKIFMDDFNNTYKRDYDIDIICGIICEYEYYNGANCDIGEIDKWIGEMGNNENLLEIINEVDISGC